MLYRFSHILLYTVVLVSTYSIEARVRTVDTQAGISSSTLLTTQLNACKRIRLLIQQQLNTPNAKKTLLGDDLSGSLTAALSKNRIGFSETLFQAVTTTQSSEWAQRKLCTELLI